MMAKVPLSPLSLIMPQKGAAAQAETMTDIESRAEVSVGPDNESRDGLTIRVKRSISLRLRTMAFQENRTKQALLDQAIQEFLDRSGY